MARKSLFLLFGLATIALTIMVGLGAWQMERLAWKNELVATIDARVGAPPVPLSDMLGEVRVGGDIRYLRVSASGQFDFEREIYMYSFDEQGVGWLVYSPFITDLGVVIVNRGFVPDGSRDPASRRDAGGARSGPVNITGLARVPGRQTLFVPDNNLPANNWYWNDLEAMAAEFEIPPESVLPFFLDLQSPAPAGGLPRPGTTRVELTNRHLEYAITWFGLAVAFAIIFVIFLWKQVRQTP